MTESPNSRPRPDGALARGVRRAARVAAARPRTAIALWLILVIGCVLAGGTAGTRSLTETESGVGESQRADQRIEAAGLRDPAVERRRRPPPGPRRAGVPAQRLTRRVSSRAPHGSMRRHSSRCEGMLPSA